MVRALYLICIYPLYQLIEICYFAIYKLFDNPGISVIGVSVAVTLLCLPLYIVAEKWQEVERETQKRLKPGIDRIKAVFKGDEQYMILTTFYRQNHYHPMMALRSSFGLLIQVPFFMAAYSFLSNNEALKGVSFLCIRDMGAPDALFSIGSFGVNVLPILMTAINIVAGAVYTKGFSLKEKVQIYGMALIFLVLLYNSPAGLVLYWTMNNVFSLVKNVFYKLKNPVKALYVTLCAAVTLMNIYLLFVSTGMTSKRILMVVVISVVYIVPLILKLMKKAFHLFASLETADKERNKIFIITSIACALLTGFVLPSLVISSSVQEFSFIDNYASPMAFIWNVFFQAVGFCFVWPMCIYFLFSRKIQTIFTVLASCVCVCSICNAFLFVGDYGTITANFNFTDAGRLKHEFLPVAVNLCVLLGLLAGVLLLYARKKEGLVKVLTGIVFATFLLVSAWDAYVIRRDFSEYQEIILAGNSAQQSELTPIFNFSKTEPNILVVMIDCAVNGFVKPIFNEFPELETNFDGFTLYPNTVSYAMHTHMASPPIWGGYEYTPRGMNARPDEAMVDKHNEALLVLPTLLDENNFSVTVTDPSWANYSYKADIRPYEKYPHITALNTIGNYSTMWYKEHDFADTEVLSRGILRNSIFFCCLKQMPLVLREFVYDQGKYWNSDDTQSDLKVFVDNYAVLDYLPKLTSYTAEKSAAVLLTNEATHSAILLQHPDYVPVSRVTSWRDDEYARSDSFHGNIATLRALGRWFAEMKKNGVYDNTRIIVVSDHGNSSNAHIADDELDIPGERREKYNPVLMEKDFGAHGSLKMDMAFMTNADVPLMALNGIVENPCNPFTGKKLTPEKKDGVWISINHAWEPGKHHKNTFKIAPSEWVYVKDNIFDKENWRKAE